MIPRCLTPTLAANSARSTRWVFASRKSSVLLRAVLAEPSFRLPRNLHCSRVFAAGPRRSPCYNARMKAHVWVMLKSTVLDPQGTAIQQALASLGHAAFRDVRQGKFFVLDLQNVDRA